MMVNFCVCVGFDDFQIIFVGIIFFLLVYGDIQEVPNWLWEDVDENSYFMPVNTLKFTEERIVKRV